MSTVIGLLAGYIFYSSCGQEEAAETLGHFLCECPALWMSKLKSLRAALVRAAGGNSLWDSQWYHNGLAWDLGEPMPDSQFKQPTKPIVEARTTLQRCFGSELHEKAMQFVLLYYVYTNPCLI